MDGSAATALQERDAYIVKLKKAINTAYKYNQETAKDYARIAEICDDHKDAVDFASMAAGVMEANMMLYKLIVAIDTGIFEVMEGECG